MRHRPIPLENKALYRRYVEETNKQNLAVLDELCAPDSVFHGTGVYPDIDLAASKQLITAVWTAFPDLHYRVEDLIAEGDKVASIHKAKRVQAWLAEHPQVQLLYLPAYSGHKHNSVEKIWWRLKDRIAANRLPGSIDALVEAVHEFFASFTPEDALRLAA